MEKSKILPLEEIERSIIKRYRKPIWREFISSVKKYQLVNPGDKIAVAISGGKDSLLLAKLLQELQRHGPYPFDLAYIAMDPGYSKENRERLEFNCSYLGLDVDIFDSDIFEVSEALSKGKDPCYMCARMRRGALYARAKDHGCNKLALGHHFNDVIETSMINILMAGSFKTMLPKLKSENFNNLELIRPMYSVRERSIITWIENTGLEPLDCACSFSQKKESSARVMVKELIEDLKKYNKNIDINIFRAPENVNADMVLGWKKDGKRHSYLDGYEDQD